MVIGDSDLEDKPTTSAAAAKRKACASGAPSASSAKRSRYQSPEMTPDGKYVHLLGFEKNHPIIFLSKHDIPELIKIRVKLEPKAPKLAAPVLATRDVKPFPKKKTLPAAGQAGIVIKREPGVAVQRAVIQNSGMLPNQTCWVPPSVNIKTENVQHMPTNMAPKCPRSKNTVPKVLAVKKEETQEPIMPAREQVAIETDPGSDSADSDSQPKLCVAESNFERELDTIELDNIVADMSKSPAQLVINEQPRNGGTDEPIAQTAAVALVETAVAKISPQQEPQSARVAHIEESLADKVLHDKFMERVSRLNGTDAAKKLNCEEAYKLPFTFGWKREVVYRASPENSNKKADVYYTTPAGKRLRAMTDIQRLAKDILPLTPENFTFRRMPLGVEDQFESIRPSKILLRTLIADEEAAKLVPQPNITEAVAAEPIAVLDRSARLSKRVSIPKAPKGASPPPQNWSATSALKENNAALRRKQQSLTRTCTVTNATVNANSTGNAIVNTIANVNATTTTDMTVPLLNLRSAADEFSEESPQIANTVLTPEADQENRQEPLTVVQDSSMTKDGFLRALTQSSAKRTRALNTQSITVSGGKKFVDLPVTATATARKIIDKTPAPRPKYDLLTQYSFRQFQDGQCFHKWMPLGKYQRDPPINNYEQYVDMGYSSSTVFKALCEEPMYDKIEKIVGIINGPTTFEAPKTIVCTKLQYLSLHMPLQLPIHGNLDAFSTLTALKTLSLTGIKDLSDDLIKPLFSLSNLKVLRIGNCNGLEGDTLPKLIIRLKALRYLRLEHTFEELVPNSKFPVLSAIKAVAENPTVKRLDLINYQLGNSAQEMYDALKKCTSLRSLLLVPCYTEVIADATAINSFAFLSLVCTTSIKRAAWYVDIDCGTIDNGLNMPIHIAANPNIKELLWFDVKRSLLQSYSKATLHAYRRPVDTRMFDLQD